MNWNDHKVAPLALCRFKRPVHCRGAVTLELVVAIGILLTVMLPLAYSFTREQRLARVYYLRAIAMQLVDGEAEVLAAGGWRAFLPGRHVYPVRADAATNLPPGQFILTIADATARLEWQPARANQGGSVSRTIPLRREEKVDR